MEEIPKMVLYLEKFAESESSVDKNIFRGVSLRSFLCLYVLDYVGTLKESSSINIVFVSSKTEEDKDSRMDEEGFDVDLGPFLRLVKRTDPDAVMPEVSLPALHTPSEKYYIAGLCSVLRHVLLSTAESSINLLGYNRGCLSAPAEVSEWTKFVEVDLPRAILCSGRSEKREALNSLAKFEAHMKQPVKIHNIRKLIKGQSIAATEEDPIKEYARTMHLFSEGPKLLLSDLIIYPSVYLLFERSSPSLAERFPKIKEWYDKCMMKEASDVMKRLLVRVDFKKIDYSEEPLPFSVDTEVSLYKRDPKRSNPKSRAYTRQQDVERVMSLLESKNDLYFPTTNMNYNPIDWESLPPEIHPKGGGLPSSRLIKKCQQLECLVHAVLSLSPRDGDTIVDFCSGGGHLAILLAYFLPQCRIHLVENKSESLKRAQARCRDLPNVSFFQCNMDYFRGSFDIGTSLHACGVATDLVLFRCIKENAHFVTCPCCYGSISDNHVHQYPLSSGFQSLVSSENYYILCHSADQIHPEGSDNSVEKSIQGRRSMNWVDSDRLGAAKESGYDVLLSRLIPESCTPKNNVLVGRYSTHL